jgi:hypothetical protein
MKTLLLTTLLFLTNHIGLANDPVKIQKRNGVLFVQHKIQVGETIFQLAKDYSLRPAVLSQFNSLAYSTNLSEIPTIDIPLTETNFFKFSSLTENGGFLRVIYALESNMNANAICTRFGISSESFLKWNNSSQTTIFNTTDEVTIGWLKYAKIETKVAANNEINTYKSIEKPLEKSVTNTSEKEANGNRLSKKNSGDKLKIISSKIATSTSNTWHKIKNTLRPKASIAKVSKKAPVANSLPKATPNCNESNPKKRHHFFSTIQSKWNNLFEKKEAKKISSEPQNIKPKEPRKPMGVFVKEKWHKFANWTKEVKTKIATKKSNVDYRVKSNSPYATQGSVVKRDETILKREVKNEVENNAYTATKPKSNDIEKETNTSIAKEVEAITTKLNVKVNESRNIQFSSTKSGKASFFFSGPSEGKFYVVTSLAKKGSIVKITDTETGKTLMAEVISALPPADAAKGLLIKVSENAKLALKQKASPFNVKISY